MKFTKLRLFFLSRECRKMFFRYIKATIEYCVKKPFMYVKAIYDTIRLYIDYPNRWDRYVKIKEIENKNEKEISNQAKAIAYTNFIGAIFSFKILLLAYCNYINRDDVTDENYETLYAKFNQIKDDLKKYVSELEKMGVVIPNELKAIIEDTTVDKFDNFDEYKIFSDKIHAISDTINITYITYN